MRSQAGLEEAMRDELGPDVEVETHIEPLPADVLAGRDASPRASPRCAKRLAALAGGIPGLDEVHDVRVRDNTRRRDRQFSLQCRRRAFGGRRA